jgi:YhgE/Pip-like protein
MAATKAQAPSPAPVRARQVLRNRKTWIVPLVLASAFIAVMSAIYFGSIVNPTGHLHGLPVLVVNQDTGADGTNIGDSVVDALRGADAVTSRLALTPATLAQARAKMDRGQAYGALVIPPTFTHSALLAAGVNSPGVPATATVELQENTRLGALGVNLAAGVLTPAIKQISPKVGEQLSAKGAHPRDAIVADRLANPIAMTATTYRPLPDHTALGLSAFYVALLGIMCGFVGATLINNSIDSVLGYARTEMGPRYRQRMPLPINRVQTLLVKWAVAAAAAPLLTGILLLVSVGALGLHAPNVVGLWLLIAFAALMVSVATLTLMATFGAIGQLIAMILLVYLSLASSGGTVPIDALPGTFRVIGHVEPLRNVLSGTRSILYFDARWDAGLRNAVIVIGAQLAFWALLGLGVTRYYDRRRLDRVSPEILALVNRTVQDAHAKPA